MPLPGSPTCAARRRPPPHDGGPYIRCPERAVAVNQDGGRSDRLIDLRVDEHATPIAELARVFAIHDLLFGETPRAQWIDVDGQLLDEIGVRLAALGYDRTPLLRAFNDWVGTENLEERADGLSQIDPVVLAALRGEIG